MSGEHGERGERGENGKRRERGGIAGNLPGAGRPRRGR